MNTIFPATAPQRQVERLFELSIGRKWGFEMAEFDYAERHIPRWPDGELVVVTLVPYLRGKSARVGSVKRTFQELLNAATKEQKRKKTWSGFKDPGPDILRISDEGYPEPGLRWEIIDLGANQGRSLGDILRNDRLLPHAGILASAALHPEWVRQMDDPDIPFTIIGGYVVKRFREWDHAPLISFDGRTETITVDVVEHDANKTTWSIPRFLHAP